MAWFDSVRKKQEAMSAEAFNDDETFKSKLIEVGTEARRGHPGTRGVPGRRAGSVNLCDLCVKACGCSYAEQI
jgi:hypothetical protein